MARSDIDIIDCMMVDCGYPAVRGPWSRLRAKLIEGVQNQSGEAPVQQAKVKISTRKNCQSCQSISKQFGQCSPGTNVLC